MPINEIWILYMVLKMSLLGTIYETISAESRLRFELMRLKFSKARMPAFRMRLLYCSGLIEYLN